MTMHVLSGQAVRNRGGQLDAFNRELIGLSTDSGKEARTRLGQIARSRSPLLAEILQSDPAEALRLALPDNILDRLRAISPEIGRDLESRGEWSGSVQVTVEDDFAHGASRTHTSLRSEGRDLELYFAGPQPELRSGTTLRTEGLRVGQMLAVRDAAVLPHASTGCSSTGVQKIAVLLVNFASSQIPAS